MDRPKVRSADKRISARSPIKVSITRSNFSTSNQIRVQKIKSYYIIKKDENSDQHIKTLKPRSTDELIKV